MARQLSQRRKIATSAAAWLAAFIIFFPILWMILTSFKPEVEAVATPPKLFFSPTLENYITVRERADYVHFAINSIVISVGATLLATIIAVPAAYAMAFFPGKRTKDLLLWMLSTKMMPAVVIEDPELTVGLPPQVTAATGMDALSRCLEAYSAPGFHPLADGIAVEGMREPLLGGTGWEGVGRAVAILLPLSAVSLALGAVAFRAALRRERRQGTLGLY